MRYRTVFAQLIFERRQQLYFDSENSSSLFRFVAVCHAAHKRAGNEWVDSAVPDAGQYESFQWQLSIHRDARLRCHAIDLISRYDQTPVVQNDGTMPDG